jgi:small subunit ribosomal protein S20
LANHKSALKRAQQSEIKRLRNKVVRTNVKSITKEVLSEIETQSKESAIKLLNKAKSVIDVAAKKGVLHKNTAARKISRLTRKINNLEA